MLQSITKYQREPCEQNGELVTWPLLLLRSKIPCTCEAVFFSADGWSLSALVALNPPAVH